MKSSPESPLKLPQRPAHIIIEIKAMMQKKKSKHIKNYTHKIR